MPADVHRRRFTTKNTRRGWECPSCLEDQQKSFGTAHLVRGVWNCAVCKNEHLRLMQAYLDGEVFSEICIGCNQSDLLCGCTESVVTDFVTFKSLEVQIVEEEVFTSVVPVSAPKVVFADGPVYLQRPSVPVVSRPAFIVKAERIAKSKGVIVEAPFTAELARVFLPASTDRPSISRFDWRTGTQRRVADPFVKIISRLRLKGREVLEREKQLYVVKNLNDLSAARVEVGLTCQNSFSRLSAEVAIVSSPITGNGYPCGPFPYKSVRKMPRKVKNLASALWADRCLERKVFFGRVSVARRDANKKRFLLYGNLPNSFETLSSFCSAAFGKSAGDYLRTLRVLKRNFICPKNGFVVDFNNGASVTENIYDSGISFRLRGKEIVHCGDRSPTSIRFHRRSSSIKTENSFYEAQQSFIDSIPNFENNDKLTAATFLARVSLPSTFQFLEYTPTILFGLALRYKSTYGCPGGGRYVVNVDRYNQELKFVDDSGGEKPNGLYWHLDNKFYYHSAESSGTYGNKDRTRMLFWKLAAKKLLLDAQSKGKVAGPTAIKIAKTTIPCTKPWFDKTLLGFRVCAKLQGSSVYSRGLDFSRPDYSDPSGSMLTVRQEKKFWSVGNGRLVFTPKGLAKIFYRKGQGEIWRFALCRALGLTLNAGYRFFAQFANNVNDPDVVLEQLGEEIDEPLTIHTERVEYVEIPVVVKEALPERKILDPEIAVVTPPPPPLPPKQVIKVEENKPEDIANGDDWLSVDGAEGKSRRAVFRSVFPTDWWLRISDGAMKYMNQDSSRLPDYTSKSFNASALITDPKDNFNISKIPSRPKVSLGTAQKRPNLLSGLSDARSRMKKVETKDRSAPIAGKVKEFKIQNNDHLLPRDSTSADIEENPGPDSGDKFTVQHPTPNDVKKQHKRKASQLVTERLGLAQADFDSPLDQNFVQTTPTPITPGRLQTMNKTNYAPLDTEVSDEVLIENLHLLPETPAKYVVEKNPGPSDDNRGRRDDEGHVRARSVSRIRDFFRSTTDEAMALIHDEFGFGKVKENVVTKLSSGESSWLNENYDQHYLVGTLPKDRDWQAKPPTFMWSMAGLGELQNSLDQMVCSEKKFTVSNVKLLVTCIETFFKLSDNAYPVNSSKISALAHMFKYHRNCPGNGDGFAVNIRPQEKEVTFHVSRSGRTAVANRLWWAINGNPVVHGGAPQSTPSLSSYRIVESFKLPGDCWSFATLEPRFWVTRGIYQKTIDSIVPENGTFSWELVKPAIIAEVERYPNKKMCSSMVGRLASALKCACACPGDGDSFGVNVTEDGTVQLMVNDHPNESEVDKIWWFWKGFPYLHGGNQRNAQKKILPSIRVVKEMAWADSGRSSLGSFTSFRERSDSEILPWTREEWEGALADSSSFLQPHAVRFLHYLYFICYNYIFLIYNSFISFNFPDIDYDPDFFTCDESDFGQLTNDEVPSSLLLAAFGTYGDQTPVKYYGRLASHFGVRSHMKIYKDMSLEDLQQLKRGNLLNMVPSYLDLAFAPELGYRRVMMPHLETELSTGISYSLQPSTRWIRRIKYIADKENTPFWNYPVVEIAERLAEVFSPNWRIGALSDCNLPRSTDGYNLLRGAKQTGENRVGWLHGSASIDVIPKHIRESFEHIIDTDHQKAFRKYSKIHMHGGAGTVQTAIACGSNPIVHDVNLDRDYHNIPGPSDFSMKSVAPFMGWLCWSGFKIDAPLIVKAWWTISFGFSIKWYVLSQAVLNVVKLYTLWTYLTKHWAHFAIIFFSVSMMVWKILYRSNSIYTIASYSGQILWDLPVLCLLNRNQFSVFLLWLAQKTWPKLSQDFLASRRKETCLVFEPVVRNGIEFIFPFGHWCLYDETTATVYEGKFQQAEQGIGHSFRFSEVKRPLKPSAKKFWAPFNVAFVKSLVRNSVAAPYSSTNNCVTDVCKVMWKRSVVWTVFTSSIACFIWLSLSPPELLRKISKFFFPSMDVDKTPFYRSLGFAAGIENIPFELEDEEVKEPVEPKTEGHPEDVSKMDLNSEESLDALIGEISFIQNHVVSMGLKTLDEDDHQEVAERAFTRFVTDVKIPEENMVLIEPLPAYVKHTWAEIVDRLHHAISFLKDNGIVNAFISWMKTIAINVLEFMSPILELLSRIANLAITHSRLMFRNLFVAVCDFLDHTWGLEASRRVKTVWGLTGLHKTGVLGIKARLAASVAYSEFSGRHTFQEDYDRLVNECKTIAEQVGAKQIYKVGKEQRRRVGFSKPLMSNKEAELLGFEEGEFVTDREYQDRIDSYLKQGVTQGADGVFLATKMPELIAKSQHRYEPKYAALSSNDRQMSMEIAQALYDQYPEVFANADVVAPNSVLAYIKKKYSPGTPFINEGGFKSRQALFDSGYDRVLKTRAKEYLESGRYPVQFYHAFVKSQVVDITKCLPIEQGGKNKDVRTVVSQDLLSYMQDQYFQIERNKRINWDTYGAGIGMPLNQSMQIVYDKMADAKKERGGRYIIMDGRAFDSLCKPFLFQVGGDLWSLGYKDHPSGNGKNIASVIKASYDARQNAWIIGVTEPEYSNLCIGVPSKEVQGKLRALNDDKLVFLEDLVDQSKYFRMTKEEKIKYVASLSLPDRVTVVTNDPKLRPKSANWMGNFVFGDLSEAEKKFQENQTFTYDPSNFEDMKEDIGAIAHSNYKLLSNVHPKNRGGSTGGSDTSNINTHAFKAGVIYAWCKTTGRPAKEFFEYNTLANTSDDTIWQSGGKFGLNTVDDVNTFAQHCLEVGIDLEIETTKDITKVEYLSKFVRIPTAEDSAALKCWRSQKFKAIAATHKARGLPVPTKVEELNNPRFIVVQNPNAILLRRSAFRYYQASFDKWRYTSIERGAGHALNTAFVPDLYSRFAIEWCDDVNVLLERHKIPKRYKLVTGQFGLPNVEPYNHGTYSKDLSPRQKSFLEWLRGSMFPSYYRVIDIHMNVAKIDPELHNKFLRKLEKGWRGWDQIIKEGVDGLFAATNMIPDEWSKKFQPGISMLYVEHPFYTKNNIVEKFVYTSLLKESKDEEITFGDFSSRVQESPYGGVCDIYHFWEKLQDKDYKDSLFLEDPLKFKGLTLIISILYMFTSSLETVIYSLPTIGWMYALFMWSFVGLNKVYGITNTAFWHSTGKSSREISRVMPKDPYLVSKQFCAFVVDFIPEACAYLVLPMVLVLDMLPPFLESIGKTWYVAGEIKQVDKTPSYGINPWSGYASDYIAEVRKSPTKRAYVAAKTATGKSTMFVNALIRAKHLPDSKFRKLWLVEPRKILRDETEIPETPYQQLYKGIVASVSIDVYVLTYGHLLSRLGDVDIESDIVLFDEFHELQGEMILGLDKVKAPIILLSATPAEIPSLSGSTYLTPKIDRRFPIKVHKFPDSMAVLDAVVLANNMYPELMSRALIIVPTHKEVVKVIEGIRFLKLGYEVTALTARERTVPKTGIIVSTPYVQTGADIKPAVSIVIDCGRDFVLHRGRPVYPIPWTDKDTNNQRIGRTGRLKPGVVFQPESAGTGNRAEKYPSPILFQHEVVAKHFKVPPLNPISNPVSYDLNFMRFNTSKVTNLGIQKSLSLVHAFSLAGIRQLEWEGFYSKKLRGERLNEDYEFIERVYNNPRWSHINLIPYKQAMYHLNRTNMVQYNIGGKHRWCLPLSVIDGQWQETEFTPTEKMEYESISSGSFELAKSESRLEVEKIKGALRSYLVNNKPEGWTQTVQILS